MITQELWKIIGSALNEEAFKDQQWRRMIETVWMHVVGEAEALGLYNEWLADAQSPMLMRRSAPWGTHIATFSLADPVEQTEGVLLATRLYAQQVFWVYAEADIVSVGELVGLRFGGTTITVKGEQIIPLRKGYLLKLKAGSSPITGAMVDMVNVEGSLSVAPREDIVFGPLERFDSTLAVDPVVTDDAWRISLDGTEASLVADSLEISRGKSFTSRHVFSVSAWPDNTDPHELSVKWSSADDIEVRIVHGVSGIEVLIEKNAGLIETLIAASTDLADSLSSASLGSPKLIEVEFSWDEPSRVQRIGVWIDGGFYQSAPITSDLGRMTGEFEVSNTTGDLVIDLLAIVSDGERIYGIDAQVDDRMAVVGEEASWRYICEDPIVSAIQVRTSGFPFLPQATILSHLDDQILVKMEDGWYGWAPEHIRIFDSASGFWEGERISQLDDQATYSVRTIGSPAPITLSTIQLAPWYLRQDELSFPEPGVMETAFEMPQDLMVVERCEVVGDLEAWSRWGNLAGVRRTTEDQRLIERIRGVWAAMHSYPEPDQLSAAIEKFLGMPYIRQTQRMPLTEGSVNQIQGDRIYELPGYISADRLVPEGTLIGPRRQMLRRPIIVDWVMDLDLMIRNFGHLSAYGHFLVQLPSDLGLGEGEVVDLVRLIERGKKKDKGYIIQSVLDAEPRFDLDHLDPEPDTISVAGSRMRPSDDLVFDGLEPVMVAWNDPLEPDIDQWSVMRSGRARPNRFGLVDEGQARTDSVPHLPGRPYSLGTPSLGELDVQQTHSGRSAALEHRLLPREAAFSFSRSRLRFERHDTSLSDLALGTRPNELVKFDSVISAVQAPAALEQIASAAFALPSANPVEAFDITNPALWIIADNAGGSWTSGDYGATWGATGLAPTGYIRAAANGVFAGEAGEVWVWDGAAWQARPATVPAGYNARAADRLFDRILVSFDDGVDTIVASSDDLGVTWQYSPAILGEVGAIVLAGVDRDLLLTGGSIYKVDHTDPAVLINSSVSSVEGAASGGRYVLITSFTNDLWRLDLQTLYLARLTAPWPAAAFQVTSLGPSWFVVGAGDNNVYQTVDAGESWTVIGNVGALPQAVSSSPRPAIAAIGSGGLAWT